MSTVFIYLTIIMGFGTFDKRSVAFQTKFFKLCLNLSKSRGQIGRVEGF